MQEACCRPRGPACDAGAIEQVHSERRAGMGKQVPHGRNTCKAAAYDGVPPRTLACIPPIQNTDSCCMQVTEPRTLKYTANDEPTVTSILAQRSKGMHSLSSSSSAHLP